MQVYLDNAATTKLDERVLEAMLPYMKEQFGNPSSIHAYGRETKAAIERARKQVAQYLNASTGEIFFTSGGTESANMAIHCAIEKYGIKQVITSRIEHHCVLHPLETLAKQQKIELQYVEVNELGNVSITHLETLLSSSKEKTLVCLMYANNEVGTLLNVEAVGARCKEHDSLFFSDTVQAIGHYQLDMQELQLDFISGAAHKFHGPKGIGFIYINENVQVPPYLEGGGQERNMRAGTENLYGIIGLARAMELAYEDLKTDQAYVQGLKEHFWKGVQEIVPDAKVVGHLNEGGLYTVLNVSFPPADNNDFLIYNLDMNGIAASAGSACSSGSNIGSHVLQALNVPADRGAVRFSFSRMNTQEELDYALGVLKNAFKSS